MARTAIPVTSVANYQESTVLSAIAFDAVNGMSLDLSTAPKLMLAVLKSGGGDATITFTFPASKHTYDVALVKTATAENGKFTLFVIDIPPEMAQSGNVLHVDSDGGYLMGYTWDDTPQR